MTFTSRIVAVSVVLSLMLAGPLAPMTLAQQPPQQPAEQPAQPPTQPPPHDLFREAVKGQVGYQAMTPAEQALDFERNEMDAGFYDVAAGVTNVFLVPGRAITCAAGSAVGLAFLLATFGTAYRAATRIAEEGCGGKWTVRGTDLRPDRPVMKTPGE